MIYYLLEYELLQIDRTKTFRSYFDAVSYSHCLKNASNIRIVPVKMDNFSYELDK